MTGGGGGGGGDDGEGEEEKGRKEQKGQRSACKQTNQWFSGTIALEVSRFSWVTDWMSTRHHLSLCGIGQSDNGKHSMSKATLKVKYVINEHFVV